jgi:hypothetical protein
VASSGWNGRHDPSGGDDITQRRIITKPIGVGKQLLKAGVKKLVDRFRR